MDGNLTGRDGLIIKQALALAIEAIDLAPPERQPLSNQEDMRVLLMTMCSGPFELTLLTKEARHTLTGERLSEADLEALNKFREAEP